MSWIMGWLSATCLGLCALPQVYKSIRNGNSGSISWIFLWLWFVGEVAGLAYVLPKMDWPLVANYAANSVMVGVILWYRRY